MNSNEINARMLDARLDSGCFQLLYAYMWFGGWEEGREVFLSTKYIKQWGLNKSTIKRHRKELIEAGWLIPTKKKSDAGFDIYTVRIPDAQPLDYIDTSPSSDRTIPPTTLSHPLAHIDPKGSSYWSTEVSNNNTDTNASQSEEEVKRVADAPVQSERFSARDIQEEASSVDSFADAYTEAPAAGASASSPSSDLTIQVLEDKPTLNEKEKRNSSQADPATARTPLAPWPIGQDVNWSEEKEAIARHQVKHAQRAAENSKKSWELVEW